MHAAIAGQDRVINPQVDRGEAVRGGDHLLVDLFAGPDAGDRLLAARPDRLCQIGDPVAGDLGHEQFAAQCMLQRPQHHGHAFAQYDVEAGHRRISDRQHAGFRLLQKEGNHRAARAHHIAVAHHRKAQITGAYDVIGGNE